MRHTSKGKRFTELLTKADLGISKGYFFETAWICYSILEERLNSLVSAKMGLLPPNHGKTMDHMIKVLRHELNLKTEVAEIIKIETLDKLDEWRKKRNMILKKMIKETWDPNVFKKIAIEGRRIVGEFNSQLMKFKKKRQYHGNKIHC